MTSEIKITKKVVSTLNWLKTNQPVEVFTKDDPSLRYIKKLVVAGLVEPHKELTLHPKFNGGIVRYSLSKAGNKVLKQSSVKNRGKL